MTPPPAPKFRPLLLSTPRSSEEPETRRDPLAVDAGGSYIRLRAAPRTDEDNLAEAQEFIDQIGDAHLNLTVELVCLRRTVEELAAMPRGATLARALEHREAVLVQLRDALERLHVRTATRRLHPIFLPDGPLADYLRGLYDWLDASVRAFGALVASVRFGRPDWALFRFRLSEARAFHFPELDAAIRADVTALEVVTADAGAADDARSALEPIFQLARDLEVVLDAPLV